MRRSSYRFEEITSVAVELAEHHGVGGVTTAALARRLKFTEAALYRHFPGKNAILAAALNYLADRLLATMLLELAPEAAASPAEVTVQLQRHVKRFAAGDGLLLEFLLHAATSRGEELRVAGERFLREYIGRVEAYFGAGPVDGDEKELARLWLCQLMGGFVRNRLIGEPWDPIDQPGFHAFLGQLERLPSVTT